MGRSPDVSVIIPAYNAAPYLERSVGSVVAQTLGLARMQVIIVDDGSTDTTPAMLDRMADEYPAIEVIHQANSGGPATPRNVALERVRGRYVFFLDQDDYLSPDALGAMVRCADENGTDIVVARMKGVGGRVTPRPMFARTIPSTDLFSTPSLYRLLNPIKLFRTELVRSLGVLFRPDFQIGEDLPFVATAYLKANGISILADKDYIFWVNREDDSNITRSARALAERLPAAIFMIDLVARNVPAGPQRDVLMTRHFHIELLHYAFVSWGWEPDPAAREAAFAQFRDVVDAYYDDRIEAALPPRGRVLVRLVAENRPDRFAAYLAALEAAEDPAPTIVEGEHVFLALPWFRDPAQGLPDDLFDIAPGLAAYCRLQPLNIGPDGLRLSATVRLGGLTDRVSEVALVARSSVTGNGSVIPLAFTISLEERLPVIQVEDAVPFDRLLGLPQGEDSQLCLRLSAGGIHRECRAAECSQTARVRILRGRTAWGVLTTDPKGRLSLHVDDRMGAIAHLAGRFGRRVLRPVRRLLGRTRA